MTRVFIVAVSWLLAVGVHADEPDPILWSVAVSADGLVATSGEPTAWLYDARTLEPDVRGGAMPGGGASAVDFHPTRPLLAAAGRTEITGRYDLGSGVFTPIATDEGARSIAFNHDGSLVALAEHSGALSVWAVDDNPRRVYTYRPSDAKSLTGVAWHPTENTLVSIGEFITLHNLNLLPDPTDDRPSIAIRAEPTRIAHRPDAAGYCLLLSVDWHPDGGSFLVSDYGHHPHDPNDPHHAPPAIQHRSADGTLIRTIEREGAEFRNVRWSPDGTHFAATSDALLVYTAEGELLHEADADANLWGLAWSPDGGAIFTTNESGGAARWSSDASGPSPFGR